jgi:hypothetical protein
MARVHSIFAGVRSARAGSQEVESAARLSAPSPNGGLRTQFSARVTILQLNAERAREAANGATQERQSTRDTRKQRDTKFSASAERVDTETRLFFNVFAFYIYFSFQRAPVDQGEEEGALLSGVARGVGLHVLREHECLAPPARTLNLPH